MTETKTENPRVLYRWNSSKYTELEFVKWTPKYLVVKYPPNSTQAGEDWRLGRQLVNKWLNMKVLRIQGPIPDWALVI